MCRLISKTKSVYDLWNVNILAVLKWNFIKVTHQLWNGICMGFTHWHYSGPPLIGTLLRPCNSVLIRGVLLWEDHKHSWSLLPRICVLTRGVSCLEGGLWEGDQCTHSNEFILQPAVILHSVHNCLGLAIDHDRGMADIWELGRWVVSPDNDVLHILGRCSNTCGDL